MARPPTAPDGPAPDGPVAEAGDTREGEVGKIRAGGEMARFTGVSSVAFGDSSEVKA